MAVRLTTRSGWWLFRDAMGRGDGFVTSGALRGEPGECVGVGRLPRAYWDSVAGADYVAFSYDTPIAWRDSEGAWVAPDVSYSATTSRHQRIISVAVDHLG